jgi:SAM-dependent methyltransferase
MFDVFAEFYDAIYKGFKDYAAEADAVASLVRKINPASKTILDVACGTGEHARLLAERGFVVDGLDVDATFVRLARQKHPAGRFFEADMANFQLSARYDVVMCLFSSIGYLRTLDRVSCALKCFREHLAPGGVIIVEPWFAPGVLDEERVGRNSGEAGGVHIVRTSKIELEQRLSRIRFDYEITDSGGTRHATELHELGLFSNEELMDTFRAVGLLPEYDPKGPADRGLYVAVAAV